MEIKGTLNVNSVNMTVDFNANIIRENDNYKNSIAHEVKTLLCTDGKIPVYNDHVWHVPFYDKKKNMCIIEPCSYYQIGWIKGFVQEDDKYTASVDFFSDTFVDLYHINKMELYPICTFDTNTHRLNRVEYIKLRNKHDEDSEQPNDCLWLKRIGDYKVYNTNDCILFNHITDKDRQIKIPKPTEFNGYMLPTDITVNHRMDTLRLYGSKQLNIADQEFYIGDILTNPKVDSNTRISLWDENKAEKFPNLVRVTSIVQDDDVLKLYTSDGRVVILNKKSFGLQYDPTINAIRFGNKED